MGGPHVQCFDGVADCHISVHAHHCQGKGAGKHVVVVNRHHRLTQGVPKGPKAQEHVGALKTLIEEGDFNPLHRDFN